MKSFIRHFLDSCLRSLAAIGQSELPFKQGILVS